MYPEETLVKVVIEERLREAQARHLAAEALRGTEGDPLPSGPRPLLARLLERYRIAFGTTSSTTTAGCTEGGER